MLYIHGWRYQVALGMYTTAQDQGEAELASQGDAKGETSHGHHQEI